MLRKKPFPTQSAEKGYYETPQIGILFFMEE